MFDFAAPVLRVVGIELLEALRYKSAAFGGVSRIAGRVEMNADPLYRTSSAKGNPELRSLVAILEAMGMRLAVQPLARE